MKGRINTPAPIENRTRPDKAPFAKTLGETTHQKPLGTRRDQPHEGVDLGHCATAPSQARVRTT